jgi:hypothetical protein
MVCQGLNLSIRDCFAQIFGKVTRVRNTQSTRTVCDVFATWMDGGSGQFFGVSVVFGTTHEKRLPRVMEEFNDRTSDSCLKV